MLDVLDHLLLLSFQLNQCCSRFYAVIWKSCQRKSSVNHSSHLSCRILSLTDIWFLRLIQISYLLRTLVICSHSVSAPVLSLQGVHLLLQEKLFSSENRTETSLGKKLKSDMLPEIEKVHKVVNCFLIKYQLDSLFLTWAFYIWFLFYFW